MILFLADGNRQESLEKVKQAAPERWHSMFQKEQKFSTSDSQNAVELIVTKMSEIWR